MSQHTPGLVFVDKYYPDRVIVTDPDFPEGRRIIADCNSNGITNEQLLANTRRLAACWNFCDGFTTEQIEAGPDLVKLNAELLAACEAFIAADSHDGIQLAYAMAREAVARAKGAAS